MRVNSNPLFYFTSMAGMDKDTDSARLKLLFEAAKVRDGFTQASFGKEHGIGSQGMVWQYLSGETPLNVNVAKKFATALKIPVREFSPSLADWIEETSRFSMAKSEPGDPWPFQTVSPEQYANIPKAQRDILEGTAHAFAKARESPPIKQKVPKRPRKPRAA
jgi:transcriptional regulator with XRE-family HTH domain